MEEHGVRNLYFIYYCISVRDVNPTKVTIYKNNLTSSASIAWKLYSFMDGIPVTSVTISVVLKWPTKDFFNKLFNRESFLAKGETDTSLQ